MGFEDLISVIVPVYNVQKYLRRCIDSILCQSYRNLEVLLINDGSSDGSGRICDEYAALDSRVKVIHQANGGVSCARNSGLEVAGGDYIGFVDSDDYIDPEMYERMLSAIHSSGADIACVGIIAESEQGENKKVIRCPQSMKVYDTEAALSEILLSQDIGIGVWSKLYRRDVFDQVRFPIGETNEDGAVVIELTKNRTLVHVAEPMYHYVQRGGSITSAYNASLCEFQHRNVFKLTEIIQNDYPGLKDQCRFYIAKTMFDILCAHNAQSAVVDESVSLYFEDYKKYWSALLRSPCLSHRKKVKAILLRIGLLKRFYRMKKVASG